MTQPSRIKIAPSILSADFGRMGEEIAAAVEAGADYIHVDVMDGQFVPNLTFGWRMVEAIKRAAGSVPLDVHLMIDDPDRYLSDFAGAGADMMTVHVEACTHTHRTVHLIRELGARAGLALNPGTPLAAAEELLPDIDMLLVMTVNPGFGGQGYIANMEGKVRRARMMLDEGNLSTELEVDGGITAQTAPQAVQAGAHVLVAGSAIYGGTEGPKANLARIRESVTRA